METPEQSPDPLARAALLTLAGGRMSVGLGATLATHRVLRLLGFDAPGGEVVALARMVGAREIALALHAFAAGSGRKQLQETAAYGVIVDGGDALAFTAAFAGRAGIDRTALINAPLGASAAAVGIWALRRLRRP